MKNLITSTSSLLILLLSFTLQSSKVLSTLVHDGEVSLSVNPPEPLAAYNLENVLQTVPYFKATFGVLVYDPTTDKFILHYSNNMRWVAACHKLVNSFMLLANSLRTIMPDRFTPQSPEFALALGSSDYPGLIYTDCIRAKRTDCFPEGELSPIMQFGSVFKEPIIPTMIAMPVPQHNHLECYVHWMQTGEVCFQYKQRGMDDPNSNWNNPKGLVYPENIGLEFEELIPQVVWRGTDFSYLHKLYPALRQPSFEMDIASQIDLSERTDQKTAATHAIRQVYDDLIPRWKGVVWTAEAEREAERKDASNTYASKVFRGTSVTMEGDPPAVPWCNIRFAGAMYMTEKVSTSDLNYYLQFQEYGITAAGEGMSLETLGQYKYHIDLGGGGGTTWSGVIEKLGLPGMLFHHVTPTKDYFHDKLKPWMHYVPVKEDLSDLKEKFDWAESHPQKAKRISEQATEFVKWLGTREGMNEMFHQFYKWPMEQVVEAYHPALKDWREVMSQVTDEQEYVLRPILHCGGYEVNDCERLVDDISFTVHDKDLGQSA